MYAKIRAGVLKLKEDNRRDLGYKSGMMGPGNDDDNEEEEETQKKGKKRPERHREKGNASVAATPTLGQHIGTVLSIKKNRTVGTCPDGRVVTCTSLC